MKNFDTDVTKIANDVSNAINRVLNKNLTYYVLRGRNLVYKEDRHNDDVVTTVLKFDEEEEAKTFCDRMNKYYGDSNEFQYFGSFTKLEVR